MDLPTIRVADADGSPVTLTKEITLTPVFLLKDPVELSNACRTFYKARLEAAETMRQRLHRGEGGGSGGVGCGSADRAGDGSVGGCGSGGGGGSCGYRDGGDVSGNDDGCRGGWGDGGGTDRGCGGADAVSVGGRASVVLDGHLDSGERSCLYSGNRARARRRCDRGNYSSMDAAIERLRREVASLMDLDLGLMRQLLTLNEEIEELKWRRRREWADTCSSSHDGSWDMMQSAASLSGKAGLQPALKFSTPSSLSLQLEGDDSLRFSVYDDEDHTNTFNRDRHRLGQHATSTPGEGRGLVTSAATTTPTESHSVVSGATAAKLRDGHSVAPTTAATKIRDSLSVAPAATAAKLRDSHSVAPEATAAKLWDSHTKAPVLTAAKLRDSHSVVPGATAGKLRDSHSVAAMASIVTSSDTDNVTITASTATSKGSFTVAMAASAVMPANSNSLATSPQCRVNHEEACSAATASSAAVDTCTRKDHEACQQISAPGHTKRALPVREDTNSCNAENRKPHTPGVWRSDNVSRLCDGNVINNGHSEANSLYCDQESQLCEKNSVIVNGNSEMSSPYFDHSVKTTNSHQTLTVPVAKSSQLRKLLTPNDHCGRGALPLDGRREAKSSSALGNGNAPTECNPASSNCNGHPRLIFSTCTSSYRALPNTNDIASSVNASTTYTKQRATKNSPSKTKYNHTNPCTVDNDSKQLASFTHTNSTASEHRPLKTCSPYGASNTTRDAKAGHRKKSKPKAAPKFVCSKISCGGNERRPKIKTKDTNGASQGGTESHDSGINDVFN